VVAFGIDTDFSVPLVISAFKIVFVVVASSGIEKYFRLKANALCSANCVITKRLSERKGTNAPETKTPLILSSEIATFEPLFKFG